jgi:hypothetical protein
MARRLFKPTLRYLAQVQFVLVKFSIMQRAFSALIAVFSFTNAGAPQNSKAFSVGGPQMRPLTGAPDIQRFRAGPAS